MGKIGTLGAGSWGTALAVHMADAGHEVLLWARNEDFAARIERERVNTRYLDGIEFPDRLRVTGAMEELTDCDAVLVVVPSHGYREAVRRFLALMPSGGGPAVLISATKGVETETMQRMSEVTLEEAERAGRAVRFAVLSGPSFAKELAAGAPTLAVVASHDEELATHLREEFASRTLRLYSTTDVVGVEIGGTAKNVIAIAAGVVAGLNLGHNTLAALLTRGLHEITRLGLELGGEPRTMAGLAGMGDLVLTCTGGLSRNRHLGYELAVGKTLAEISGSTSMVAEGVRNSLAISKLAERVGVEMPITEQVVEILYNGKSPSRAIEDLMTRALRAEAEL